MTMVLLIVLIAVPLLEIAVMIKVGQWIGFWPAFGIVIGTFMLGASVLARSGLAAAFKVQEAMVRGETPVAAMLDGALLALAGILLVTPGFIADAFGLMLLIPPVRQALAHWAGSRMFVFGGFDRDPGRGGRPDAASPSGAAGNHGHGEDGPVIEGEFERLDERPIDGKRRDADRPDRM